MISDRVYQAAPNQRECIDEPHFFKAGPIP
jgi:hypothetical protein